MRKEEPVVRIDNLKEGGVESECLNVEEEKSLDERWTQRLSCPRWSGKHNSNSARKKACQNQKRNQYYLRWFSFPLISIPFRSLFLVLPRCSFVSERLTWPSDGLLCNPLPLSLSFPARLSLFLLFLLSQHSSCHQRPDHILVKGRSEGESNRCS